MDLAGGDPQYAIDQQERNAIFKRDAISARFFKKAEYDKDASEGYKSVEYHPVTGREMQVRVPGAGRPVYKETVFVELGISGSTSELRCRPVRDSDKLRFAREWEAFERNETAPRLGTPLSEIPFLTEVQRMEFGHSGCKTAEQLAAMSDSNGQAFMGFQQLRRRVQDYLQAASDAAPMLQMRSELEQRDAVIADLKQRVLAMEGHAPPKKRGRPPKKAPEAEAPVAE
jgi:hypothetical protein